MIRKNLTKFLTILILVTSLSACATARTDAMVSDPIEPINRAVFSFNDVLDRVLLNPFAKAYKAVVPSIVRDSVRNFIRNAKTPITLANNILQWDGDAAATTTVRFLFNTTMGIGGLYDFAETQGLEYEPEDFGQTLASWGVGNGPYVVIPVLGPSTVRDASGMVVDSFVNPFRIIADNKDEEWIYYTAAGVEGLDAKSRVVEGMEDLRENSLDYYTSVKSAYIQSRMKLINEGKEATDAYMPSYDDFE